MTQQIIGKYRIESFEQNGKILVKVFNTNAKKEWKQQIAFYSFRTEEERTHYIENLKANIETRIREKAERIAERKAFVNPAKVGDILVCSWGYDQTNIDYYQVTKVIGKMVEIQAIRGKSVEGSGESHGMSDRVTPSKGSFIEGEKPMRKLVQGTYNGKGYSVFIASYADAYLTKENEESYRSWYA